VVPGELLSHDHSVVEGEVESRELSRRKPTRLGGVISSARRAADRSRVVQNAHRMPARIAFRIGVNAENRSDPHLDSGFLARLARARLLGRFTPLAEPSGKRPAPLEGRAPAADEKDASGGVLDPRIDGDPGKPFIAVGIRG
jgi:hypothetical protein